MSRYFAWGGALCEPHEMVDGFEKHGSLKKVILFDGPDGSLRGCAEIDPPETKEGEK